MRKQSKKNSNKRMENEWEVKVLSLEMMYVREENTKLKTPMVERRKEQKSEEKCC